jgi:hypothetical protein
MKRTVWLTLLLAGLTVSAMAQTRAHQEGTIVRMRMAECIGAQHGWMAAMSGAGRVQTGELCPEYVLVTDKVVYLIVGKSSDQLVPLAEYTKYRLQKNELLIRIDDARQESRFQIKEMVLRAEWDRAQRRAEEQEAAQSPHQHLDPALLTNNR